MAQRVCRPPCNQMECSQSWASPRGGPTAVHHPLISHSADDSDSNWLAHNTYRHHPEIRESIDWLFKVLIINWVQAAHIEVLGEGKVDLTGALFAGIVLQEIGTGLITTILFAAGIVDDILIGSIGEV